ncbi:Adenylate cyclase type 10 (Germ cell soluble adenylyl cyclase) (sAC) (Testicular soluble adenylyl cyclase) [Durusdinium trenchii]|uniref:Adenylate cyclase type 10 (Germ cell soluble adenylyl cyclase) (SAC) (Testicular soluble adenylyl cyclase) n=1 Tax=Durusdinium trenchii TaxID=1381693 RepID=A0ABP0RBL4_9DINO
MAIVKSEDKPMVEDPATLSSAQMSQLRLYESELWKKACRNSGYLIKEIHYNTFAREWRCVWSEDDDKRSLTELQRVLEEVALPALRRVQGVLSVQRAVCGCKHEFKVISKLGLDAFEDWSGMQFYPEEERLRSHALNSRRSRNLSIVSELLAAGCSCREPRLARECFEEWFEKAQGELNEDLRTAAFAFDARISIRMQNFLSLRRSVEQCESALELLKASGELDSDVGIFVRRVLGDLLVRSGRIQEALLELQDLPPDADSMVSLGMAYLADENFLAARDCFECGFEELEDTEVDTPLAARCLRGLGLAYNGCGDAEGALEPLQAARTILEWRGRIGSEDGSKCLLALGDVYVELDDFEEALRCFELVCLNAEVGRLGKLCGTKDVDDLFQKIEDARLQLRHSDARRLFGDEDDTGEKRDGLRSLSWNANLEPELGMKGNECLEMSKGLTVRTKGKLDHPDEPRQLVHATERGGLDIEDAQGNRKPLPVDAVNWFQNRNNEALSGSLAFVPWILQEAYLQGDVQPEDIVLHRGSGAVVFSDASGFTALTERLALKTNGAELLSQCLTSFFTPLIQLINAYRGDVIKFSGDALMIYFPAVDDAATGDQSKFKVPPHGSFHQPDIGPMATAVLRACACCIEIQKRLHMFDTGVDGVRLCLHIGLGCGEAVANPIAILQVGGVEPPETAIPRSEYIIAGFAAGSPLEQISIAEPLAKNGETCLSPQAWEHVKDYIFPDTSRELENPLFHLLGRLDESKFTFPTVKASAQERDRRKDNQFTIAELDIIRKFVPSAVFKQIEDGTLTYVNEMRNISTLFISCSGVDVSRDEGANTAQELMASVQRICYANEGTLNKFLIDDKGMLFLLAYGLPPLVHTDDATRAVLSCFDIVQAFEKLGLIARCGVSTGRAYCGVCGSAERMEYTVLGDAVNLAARLMANAPENGILIDESTKSRCTLEISVEDLKPIKVKGKAQAVKIFKPHMAHCNPHVGVGPGGKIAFPWYDRSLMNVGDGGGDKSQLTEMLQSNVQKLCSLPDWPGICKVQNLLGGAHDESLHAQAPCAPAKPARIENLPGNSPLTGGSVVLQATAGLGKIELAQHAVVYAAQKYFAMPVIGTMGPRPQDLARMGHEMVKSCLGAYRHAVDPSLPLSDDGALSQLLPGLPNQDAIVQHLQDVENGDVHEDFRILVLHELVDVALSLIEKLRSSVTVIIVCQLELGTTLFPKTLQYFNCFYEIVSKLMKVIEQQAAHPVSLWTLCKNPEMSCEFVKASMAKGWFLDLAGLSQDICQEYMAAHLEVPLGCIPDPVVSFVYKISLGNPLYIREALGQMLRDGHIEVVRDVVDRVNQSIEDLETVEIANWSHTSMVGETMCLLESLDPLQAAVLKVSTVFTSPFSLQDLASSSCSRWSGSNYFDYMRLFHAVTELEKRGILEKQPFKRKLDSGELQMFEMKNLLIRKVGGSMLLEAQKKKVKRQALIERALNRDLPARMEELEKKQKEPHIPWYYENILTRT